jgi:formamidopyrimidine-DNA glycosylase
MPELVDLEVYAENLRPLLLGKTIGAVEVRVRAVLGKQPAAPPETLQGQQVAEIGRRGKYLVVHTTSGARLLIHLMNTGTLSWEPQAAAPPREVVAQVHCLHDGVLRLHSPSLQPPWPQVRVVPAGTEPPELADLGKEPLAKDFTRDYLQQQLLRASRRSIKAVLLDQHAVAGLGNTFVDEVLWTAHLDPHRKAGSLSGKEIATLHTALRQVLTAAIAQARKELAGAISGEARDFVAVHKEGTTACPRCGGQIAQARVAGHRTFWCPACQR